ncbi:uncharacterized protein IL334_001387 [Kwoniella shivajii]|uniref:FAD dependent oxidoreductase domain-containing protein n=1 Tax=Kwoniella shivajii TaxID=564305 RepID=A0ABZ1CS53_9TREE|nr:hypothetical protein IL334_001387 [Kwoniella shivajii]
MTFTKPSVVIVGAGEFGAATAVSLLQSGKYSKVTVLDRAAVLPAMDAASCDINKVVRFDYVDEDYCRLARQAIDVWNKEEWKGIYYQTGVVVRWQEGPGIDSTAQRIVYDNVRSQEESVRLLTSADDIVAAVAGGNTEVPVTPPGPNDIAYHNSIGGWVNASAAVNKLYSDLRALGGELVAGAEMEELLLNSDKTDVRGVRLKDGRDFFAEHTIIAMGSWTAAHPTLHDIVPNGLITATGQTIAGVQLSPEEIQRYANIPVNMHHDGSNYYMFPPNETGLVKFAFHAAGYLSENGQPRTIADPKAMAYSEANNVGWIPAQSVRGLREQLRIAYPELAKKPIAFTRMCWYSDVLDGDWVIDYAPQYFSLLIASGGAGHAFKFLPIIGDLIRARLENTLDLKLQKKWQISRVPTTIDPGRPVSARQPLQLTSLVSHKELLTAV